MSKLFDDIRSLAYMRLGREEDTMTNAWMDIEINEAIRQLNIYETYVQIACNLPVDSCNRIKLPHGFYEVVLLRANAYCTDPENPNNVNSIFGTFYFLNVPCLQSLGVPNTQPNQPQCYTGSYNINGEYIELVGNFNTLQEVILVFKSYQVDEHGYFKNQPKDLESAIAYRVAFSYMLLHSKDYDNYTKQWYDAKATAMFNYVRSKSARRVMNNNMPELISICNSIIINKNFVGRWGNNNYWGSAFDIALP